MEVALAGVNKEICQPIYMVTKRDPEEKDVGILVRVPEASGILTGKVNAETKIDE